MVCFSHVSQLLHVFLFFYLGPPKEDIFSGHLLSPLLLLLLSKQMYNIMNVSPIQSLRNVPSLINGLPLQTGYTCTHAVTSMQLQIPPCTAQVAGHTSDKSWPAELRGPSATTCTHAVTPCSSKYHHARPK